MGVAYNSRIVTDGLVLNYDFGNIQKAFGTTNLITNTGLSVYNNVPSHVTASITQTSETYKQSPVWALTLTPTTSTGVSYLTSANNPGIGVVTGGGGGTGGVYTGHSIFFKSSVPLYGPAPIYTHYSNIGGWQSTGNYDDMGDGWYRANVIWYDTVTRSDGKYWAINPASATLNVPMTIYWAAPFKESQNYSSFVSPYTSNTRGSGSGVVNLVSQSDTGETLTTGVTYNSANGGALTFDGGDTSHIQIVNTAGQLDFPGNFTVGLWIYPTQYHRTYQTMIDTYPGGATNGWIFTTMNNASQVISWYTEGSSWQPSGTAVTLNAWNYVVASRIGTTVKLYKNATEIHSHSDSSNIRGGVCRIGRGLDDANSYGNVFGKISNVQIYKGKGLTQAEISQNYNALRGRFGI